MSLNIERAEHGLSGAGGGSAFAELGGDPVEAVEDAGRHETIIIFDTVSENSIRE